MSASLDAYVSERPLPLVALVGCTGWHRSLTSRTPAADELHARYLSLPEDTTHLDHAPGASAEHDTVVLKRDWLHKHTHVVAAIVSLWFQWDADTPIAAIVSRLEAFRARLRPSCKVVLVLVQSSGSGGHALGPLGSPAKDDERLSALRKAVDLDSRSLLLLTHLGGGGLDGAPSDDTRFDDASVRRLERALLDGALQYYKDESRHNKKAKLLASSKVAAPHLVARHHFKRAYYSEVRRDAGSNPNPNPNPNPHPNPNPNPNPQGHRCGNDPTRAL